MKTQNFYGLEVLPMFLKISTEQLEESRNQLANFEACKLKPHILDNEILDKTIKAYTAQQETCPCVLNQCIKWRKEERLTSQQKTSIDKLEQITQELIKLNQQIVFLAKEFKPHSIDSILAKSDMAVALDFLAQKDFLSMERKSKKKEAPKEDRFLPPNVTSYQLEIENGVAYVFRDADIGELGQMLISELNGETHISCEVAGHPDDPMTQKRQAILEPITEKITQALQNKVSGGFHEIPTVNEVHKSSKMVVESKAITCHKCDAPVALLIFANDANTKDRLEDYARMMYSKIVEMDLPTWIIGEQIGITETEGTALILKIWPTREEARMIKSSELNPVHDELQANHCKGADAKTINPLNHIDIQSLEDLVSIESDTMRTLQSIIKVMDEYFADHGISLPSESSIACCALLLGFLLKESVVKSDIPLMKMFVVELFGKTLMEAYPAFFESKIHSPLPKEERIKNLELLRESLEPSSIIFQTMKLGKDVTENLSSFGGRIRPDRVKYVDLLHKNFEQFLPLFKKKMKENYQSLQYYCDEPRIYFIKQVTVQMGWLAGYLSYLHHTDGSEYLMYALPCMDVVLDHHGKKK